MSTPAALIELQAPRDGKQNLARKKHFGVKMGSFTSGHLFGDDDCFHGRRRNLTVKCETEKGFIVRLVYNDVIKLVKDPEVAE